MKCEHHPDHEADVVCASCGRKVCYVCATDYLGKPHCRECTQAGSVVGGPPLPISVPHPFSYFENIAQRLAADGYKVYNTVIPGGPVLVGTKLELIVLSPLRVYVVMGNLPTLDERTADLFSRMAYDHSVNLQGVLFSMQELTFALMSSPSIEQKVIDKVSSTGPDYHWHGIVEEVVHDQRTNRLFFHEGSRWIHGLLIDYIDGFIGKYLVP